MKILKIPLKARLGHFKTNYTTASKLSYDIPTFTVIEGIIGSIMGWCRADYIKKIKRDQAKLGIIIDSPMQKTVMGINVPNELVTPSKSWESNKDGVKIVGVGQRTQSYTELLIEPAYTLLFSHEDNETYDAIKERVLNLKSTYNIYFGSAFCIAEYAGTPTEFDASKEHVTKAKVISVLDAHRVKDDIDWDSPIKMITDNIPYKKDNDMTLSRMVQVLYNPMAEPIICSGEFYRYQNDEYIYLFEG